MIPAPAVPLVAILDPVHGTFREALEPKGWAFVDLSDRSSGWESRLSEPKILVVRSRTQVTRDLLASCHALRLVGRAGTGTDNIDTEALEEKGIALRTAPGANARAVVEHTWALILAGFRQIPEANRTLRRGRWEKSRFKGREVLGRTLGVVGLGRIGREVARIGLAMGMRVLGTDPFVTPAEAGLDLVRGVELEELLRESDVVTLHVPLDAKTKSLLGEEALRITKPGAFVVNTARGGLVDERALVKLLDEGHLAGAAIDVFEREPNVLQELVTHDKVVATPHIGGATAESQARVGRELAEAISAWWEEEGVGRG